MFDWREIINGYLRSIANSYYVVPNYPMLLLSIAIVVALPWLGARVLGQRGLFLTSILALGVIASTEFYWVLQPNTWDEEFRSFVTFVSAGMTAAYSLVIGLSAVAAAR